MREPAAGHTVAVLAHGQHALTRLCLARVRQSGYRGEVLLVDNGSEPPLENVARAHGCRYVRHPQNRYVNPVWNELLAETRTRCLTLLNNDCLVRDGFLDEAAALLPEHALALVAPQAVHVERLEACADLAAETDPISLDRSASRLGHVMTVDLARLRTVGFRIPASYRLWFGDDWIWGRLRAAGHDAAVATNRSVFHQTSATLLGDATFRRLIDVETRRAIAGFEMSRMRMLAGSVSPSAPARAILQGGWPGRLAYALWRWRYRLPSR
jgi:GT2 family glycosyltransferase